MTPKDENCQKRYFSLRRLCRAEAACAPSGARTPFCPFSLDCGMTFLARLLKAYRGFHLEVSAGCLGLSSLLRPGAASFSSKISPSVSL